METVNFQTIDGVTISGNLWDRGGSRSILLLHAMTTTKDSWETFADELYTRGMNVLAIDFRGHGESEGGDFKKFTNDDHQKYFLDARAGLNYLEERYGQPNFMIAGASIGANIALQCMSHDVHVKRGLLLSAGLDYYGVKALNFIENLTEDQRLLIAAAKDDPRVTTAADMADELSFSASCEREKIILETGGHGTDMLEADEDLFNRALDFLS